MGGVGITVFNDRNFLGRSATFRRDVPDLEPTGLNDRISSLRVGPGEQWKICEHSNYQGRCVVVSGAESDLQRNAWNDLVSSLRRVGGEGPLQLPSDGDYIVLFNRTNYRGNPINYNGPTPSVPNSAQSVMIGRGVWELCEGQNYSGRCVTLDQSVSDLGRYNLRNRVFSVRPVRGGSQPPPSTDDWYVVIFDGPSYRGTPTNYKRPEPNIFTLARSVTIVRGVWELCQGRNFTGRCVTLDRSVPDLRSYNLRQVASLRPITRQPR
jgi:Beta/Gamma crystallin